MIVSFKTHVSELIEGVSTIIININIKDQISINIDRLNTYVS